MKYKKPIFHPSPSYEIFIFILYSHIAEIFHWIFTDFFRLFFFSPPLPLRCSVHLMLLIYEPVSKTILINVSLKAVEFTSFTFRFVREVFVQFRRSESVCRWRLASKSLFRECLFSTCNLTEARSSGTLFSYSLDSNIYFHPCTSFCLVTRLSKSSSSQFNSPVSSREIFLNAS